MRWGERKEAWSTGQGTTCLPAWHVPRKLHSFRHDCKEQSEPFQPGWQ